MYKDTNTRRRDSLGAILEAGCHIRRSFHIDLLFLIHILFNCKHMCNSSDYHTWCHSGPPLYGEILQKSAPLWSLTTCVSISLPIFLPTSSLSNVHLGQSDRRTRRNSQVTPLRFPPLGVFMLYNPLPVTVGRTCDYDGISLLWWQRRRDFCRCN